MAPSVHYSMVMLMRGDSVKKTWWIRGVVYAATVLILATGFCLFDQHDDETAHHAIARDLCLGLLAVSLAVMSAIRLTALGWAVDRLIPAPLVVVRHIPDPPPRPALFR